MDVPTVTRLGHSRHRGTAMPDLFPLVPQTTSEERWLRWQQRGNDQDARLMRRAKGFFRGILVAIILMAVFLLNR